MIRDGSFPALSHLREFRSLQKLGRDELQARQAARLRHVVQHAFSHVPYYREIISSSGLNPSSFKLDEFAQLPLLTKRTVRDHGSSLIASNLAPSELVRDATGGSTGTPMTFFRDSGCMPLRRAQDLFLDSWFGCGLGEKVALFVSASHHNAHSATWKARLRSVTYERMLRFDPSKTSDTEIAAFLPHYLGFGAQTIKCFPNSLAIFANYAARHQISLPRVRTIFCTGESLYEGQRKQFEEAFGAQVVERYGTKECGLIASECPAHDGLHVFSEGAFVEVIDSAGRPCPPGAIGRVVVTDLFNQGMPLLRYEIGDMAEVASTSECACGSKLPKIARIIGRDRDIVTDSYGVQRPGYLFVDVVGKADLDAQVQIAQLENGNIEVRVARLQGSSDRLNGALTEFQTLIGPKLQVTLNFVEEIARDASGKYPYVVSKYRPAPQKT